MHSLSLAKPACPETKACKQAFGETLGYTSQEGLKAGSARKYSSDQVSLITTNCINACYNSRVFIVTRQIQIP